MADDPIDAFQFLRQRAGRDFKAQLPARFFLQVMRLVDDQPLVVSQHGAAHGEIGQQQGVVDYQHVGRCRLVTGLAQEAGRTAPQRWAALGGVGADSRPRRPVLHVEVQVRAVARLSFVQPHRRLADDPRLVLVQRIRVAQVVPAMQANVVGAPLELGGPDHPRLQDAGLFQDPDHGRDVLVHQLFLEVDGVGGHNHALPVGGGVQHGRQQVRDALADAGAPFNDQLPALVNCAGNRLQHLGLLRPVLEVGKGLGENAVGSQQLLHLLLGELTAHRVGGRTLGRASGRLLGQFFQFQAR